MAVDGGGEHCKLLQTCGWAGWVEVDVSRTFTDSSVSTIFSALQIPQAKKIPADKRHTILPSAIHHSWTAIAIATSSADAIANAIEWHMVARF